MNGRVHRWGIEVGRCLGCWVGRCLGYWVGRSLIKFGVDTEFVGTNSYTVYSKTEKSPIPSFSRVRMSYYHKVVPLGYPSGFVVIPQQTKVPLSSRRNKVGEP